MEAGGSLGEAQHAGDDRLKLVEFFTDHTDIGAAGIVFGKFQVEVAKKKFDDREGIADFVGDLGGEEAEGGELLVFAQRLFTFENAGVEAGVLQGDGTEAGERGKEAFLVVVEAVDVVGEDGEDTDDFVFVENGRGEDGTEGIVVWQVDDVAKLGRLDVRKFDLPPRVNDCGGKAGF